ncbi:MAG: GNAT family N-acetyltransferase [Bdellovibrionota bacterium]
MKILSSGRIHMRWLADEDTDFVIRLLNDKSFIDNIGDRNVRTRDDALKYIAKMRASYVAQGFGFFLVESSSGEKMGICGVTHRETLSHPDIGFAFLPEFCGKGFAFEATEAVKKHAEREWGLKKIVAIVSQGNLSSRKLLEKVGLRFESLIRLTPDDDEIEYYVWEKN